MKILFLILAQCVIIMALPAQNPSFQLAESMGGVNNDFGVSIATDVQGNVYTIGTFQGTADFDPGPGTSNLTSSGSYDIFISKINAAGNFAWVKRIGGVGTDYGRSVKLDNSGNIFITGSFAATVDFDPGPATQAVTYAGGSADIFILKLDPDGNFTWVKNMGGTGNDYGYSIAIDASGNIYTTGWFTATADFDPGPATANLTSSGFCDIFISKLDAAGNFIWAKNIGGANNDFARCIVTDPAGDVCIIGVFQSLADFDPGPGTCNLQSNGSTDISVTKLSSSGNLIWAKSIGGVSDDYGNSITADGYGNIFFTGYYSETVDFDPGAGFFSMSASATDIFISKLDLYGNFIWAKSVGTSNINAGVAIALDQCGSIYTAGYFNGTADFDPGPDTYNLTSAGNDDMFILKLNASGKFAWAAAMGGPVNDYCNSITVDAAGNIYTTGSFEGTCDFSSGSGTFNLNSAGSDDIFVQKFAGPSTGIKKPPSVDFDLTCYPNPASKEIFLELSEKNVQAGSWKLNIINAVGISVRQQEIDFREKIFHFSMEDLADGVYMLSINNNEGIAIKKEMVVSK